MSSPDSPARHAASRLAVLRDIDDAARQCRQPIRLTGWQREHDPATGQIIAAVDSASQPGGYITVPCGNRREAICPACARLYKGDTYQVLIAGLRGGHGIPETVAQHPAVFVTLTAPSFGPVHRGPGHDGPPPRCRPRRDKPACGHGQAMSCGQRHRKGDPAIGQPLCPGCFDYPAAVLFNASVPALWDQTAQQARRQLAATLGMSQRALRQHLRLSFGKVIEYQHRGLIHIHAVIRIDGPQGPASPPPPWASTAMLADAITAAAATPAVSLPHPRKPGRALTLAWGSQLDVKVVRRGIGGEIDDQKVAAYVAKYASKGTEEIGGIPGGSSQQPSWTTGTSPRTPGSSSPPAGNSASATTTSRSAWPGGRTSSDTAATSPPGPAGTPSPWPHAGRNAATPAPRGYETSTACPPPSASSPANGTTPAPDSPRR